jgi:hypothetical protein
MAKCKLIIKSLHDAMAECPCGWWFASTGERSKAEIKKEFNKHKKYKEAD